MNPNNKNHSAESLTESLMAEAGIALHIQITPNGRLTKEVRQKLKAFLKMPNIPPSSTFIDYLQDSTHKDFIELIESSKKAFLTQHYLLNFKLPNNHMRQAVIHPCQNSIKIIIGGPQYTHSANTSDLRRNRLINLGSLSAAIAHDQNNYYCGISNCIQILRRQNLDPISLNSLNLLEDCLNNSIKLSQTILDYGKGKSNNKECLEVYQSIETISSLFKVSLPNNIYLSLNIAKDLPSINLSPVDIDQILLNLLTNAREAIQQSGQINLSAQKETFEEKEYCVLKVRDTGIGIDRPEFNKIFLSFYSTKGVSNSGLGLDITRKIVTAASGHIKLESHLGKGSTFSIFLPAIVN